MTTIISNAFSLNMLDRKIENCSLLITTLDLKKVKQLVREGDELVSAIGHESTAKVLSQLLEMDIPMNRISITYDPYDSEVRLIVFQLRTRLPEGKILSEDELKELDYDFYLVE